MNFTRYSVEKLALTLRLCLHFLNDCQSILRQVFDCEMGFFAQACNSFQFLIQYCIFNCFGSFKSLTFKYSAFRFPYEGANGNREKHFGRPKFIKRVVPIFKALALCRYFCLWTICHRALPRVSSAQLSALRY